MNDFMFTFKKKKRNDARKSYAEITQWGWEIKRMGRLKLHYTTTLS